MMHPILDEIDQYCTDTGLDPETLGSRANVSASFYNEVIAGRATGPDVLAKVRKYMADNPKPPPSKAKPEKRLYDRDTLRHVSRDPCWRCGTNGEKGCTCK